MSGSERLLSAGRVLPEQLVVTIYAEHADDEERIWSGGLVELLTDFGFASGAARTALMRLARRGVLERSKVGRRVFYRLGPASRELVRRRAERLAGFADRAAPAPRWTIVWHALPPSRVSGDRSRLARRLRRLGFRAIQNGTWVVADDRVADVRTLVDELGLQGHVALWLADPADGVDFGPLVSRWWDIPTLVEREAEVLGWLEQFRSDEARAQLGDRDAFLIRTTMLDEVYGLSLLDPAIPSIDLPRHDELMTLARELDAALLEPASRYFRARTAAAVPVAAGRA